MSLSVLSIEVPLFLVNKPKKLRIFEISLRYLPSRKATVVGFVLCLFQALDGIFTLLGVQRYGIAVEGNPLIRLLMLHYGEFYALWCLKLISIGLVLCVTFVASRIPWVTTAMAAVSFMYLMLAIVPWTYILFLQPVLA